MVFAVVKKDCAVKHRPKQNGARKTQGIKRPDNSKNAECGEYGAIRQAV